MDLKFEVRNGISFRINGNPSFEKTDEFFRRAFEHPSQVNDEFDESQSQSLNEWFSVKEMLKYHDGYLIEAVKDVGEVVGAAYIGKQNPLTWPDGNKAELFIIGTLPAERGKGIASELMKCSEEIARKMGAKKLILNTHASLAENHRFYEKAGFNHMGILSDYYDNGDAIFFFKDLDK